MKKKKLKKRPKRILIVTILLIVIILGVVFGSRFLSKGTKKEVKEAKVVSKIDDYGYVLKSNKSAAYKKLFSELKKVLSEKEVDEKKYVKTITKMFIVDFYSLADRTAKTDVGGVDFVHESALDNFIMSAEDTFYKYVETNIYGDRKQQLPVVDKVTIDSVEEVEYSYLEEIDDHALKVKATWTYSGENSSGYQTSGTFTFVHVDHKLVLVEISNN